MNQLGFSSVFVLFVLLINFNGVHVRGASDHGIISVACKKAVAYDPGLVKYGFCVSSLEGNPKTKVPDIFALGLLSYDHTSKKGNSIKSHIDKLLKDGKQSRDIMARLKDCSKDYASIGDAMQTATGSFRGGDFAVAEIGLSIALSFIESCEGRFDGGITSPLTKEENEFNQLISISFTITEMAAPS